MTKSRTDQRSSTSPSLHLATGNLRASSLIFRIIKVETEVEEEEREPSTTPVYTCAHQVFDDFFERDIKCQICFLEWKQFLG
ncbi:hypothetical protein L1887_05747 [Cichorium endivia]|nr:hypothetical protein L1887_05747 [Cichorium endivia]